MNPKPRDWWLWGSRMTSTCKRKGTEDGFRGANRGGWSRQTYSRIKGRCFPHLDNRTELLEKVTNDTCWGEKSAKLIEAFALDTVKPEVTRPSLRGRCCTKCRRTFVDTSIETSDKDLTPGGRISRARHVCHCHRLRRFFPLWGFQKEAERPGKCKTLLGCLR